MRGFAWKILKKPIQFSLFSPKKHEMTMKMEMQLISLYKHVSNNIYIYILFYVLYYIFIYNIFIYQHSPATHAFHDSKSFNSAAQFAFTSAFQPRSAQGRGTEVTRKLPGGIHFLGEITPPIRGVATDASHGMVFFKAKLAGFQKNWRPTKWWNIVLQSPVYSILNENPHT